MDGALGEVSGDGDAGVDGGGLPDGEGTVGVVTGEPGGETGVPPPEGEGALGVEGGAGGIPGRDDRTDKTTTVNF